MIVIPFTIISPIPSFSKSASIKKETSHKEEEKQHTEKKGLKNSHAKLQPVTKHVHSREHLKDSQSRINIC